MAHSILKFITAVMLAICIILSILFAGGMEFSQINNLEYNEIYIVWSLFASIVLIVIYLKCFNNPEVEDYYKRKFWETLIEWEFSRIYGSEMSLYSKSKIYVKAMKITEERVVRVMEDLEKRDLQDYTDEELSDELDRRKKEELSEEVCLNENM